MTIVWPILSNDPLPVYFQVPGPGAAVLIAGLPTHSVWLYTWLGA